MFHEDPYRGESKNERLEFCRSDHGDDLMVVFGEEFIKGASRKLAIRKFLIEGDSLVTEFEYKVQEIVSRTAKVGQMTKSNFRYE